MFALWQIVTTAITITLVAMEIITSVSASSPCPYCCDCEYRRKTVSCLHTMYNEVPDQLPLDVKSLHLEYQNLTILNQISEKPLTHLRHLALPRNNIRTILENALAEAPHLKTLDLSYNDLDCLPRAISKETTLKELYLRNNQIALLNPDLFENLTQLQALDLSGNFLMFLPVKLFSPLRYLETLDLSNNSIIFLTKDIFGDLRRLEELRLSNNKIRDTSHGWLSGMPNLWILEMDYAVNTDRSTSTHQDHLLANPSGFIMPNIERLSLVGNAISAIPCGHLNKMPRLKHFNISYNSIQRVEKECFISLCNLVNLQLSDNKIIKVENGAFYNLTRLQTLNLSKNALNNLQPGLFNGTGITIFDVSFNKIPYIRNSTLNSLLSLEFVYLQHNHIHGIASHAFNTLHALRLVDIQRNDIKTIKNQFTNITTLTSLSLRNNKLKRVLPSAFLGTNIEMLFLDSNNLTTLDESVFMAIPSVMRITLHSNPWHCDCHIRWIKLALHKPDIFPWSYHLDINLLKCATPPKYANKTIYYQVETEYNMMCTTYASKLAIQLIVGISFAIIFTSTVLYVLKLYCKIKQLERTGADTSKCLS